MLVNESWAGMIPGQWHADWCLCLAIGVEHDTKVSNGQPKMNSTGSF